MTSPVLYIISLKQYERIIIALNIYSLEKGNHLPNLTPPSHLQMITAAVTAAILYSVKAKRDSDQAYSRRALARDTKDKSAGNAGP
jgi:hypothetical protein